MQKPDDATAIIINPSHPSFATTSYATTPPRIAYNYLAACLASGSRLDPASVPPPVLLNHWRAGFLHTPITLYVSVNLRRHFADEDPESIRAAVQADLARMGAIVVPKRARADVLIVDRKAAFFTDKIVREVQKGNRDWQRFGEREWAEACVREGRMLPLQNVEGESMPGPSEGEATDGVPPPQPQGGGDGANTPPAQAQAQEANVADQQAPPSPVSLSPTTLDADATPVIPTAPTGPAALDASSAPDAVVTSEETPSARDGDGRIDTGATDGTRSTVAADAEAPQSERRPIVPETSAAAPPPVDTAIPSKASTLPSTDECANAPSSGAPQSQTAPQPPAAIRTSRHPTATSPGSRREAEEEERRRREDSFLEDDAANAVFFKRGPGRPTGK